MQHTGLGHEAVGPAGAVRVEGTPEHLEQVAVARPRRQVGQVPPVRLREADQR
ncbi:hypothetical protein [Streptomyces sp. NPDC091259]|uniref:hypothetical protein n=1 Tax=Streptomyces sp. NPDC091259 TaxID=3365976 RepID=UPI0038237B40